jgi:uncharacterized protein YecE (DUF72 family)
MHAVDVRSDRRKPPSTACLGASAARLRIGTSGWSYADWRERFYPAELQRKDWLRWYGSQFPTTEINGSFYRTPSLEAVRGWHQQTPADFRFAWKASKFITHWKRLGPSTQNSLELLETRLAALRKKCGPVLFQLPARFTVDRGRLAEFLAMLPRKRRYAFEFRHASWYEDPIYDLLARHNVALCISDHHDAPTPWLTTARHVYVRGHGPAGRYKGSYSIAKLKHWALHIARWQRERRDVYIYFDNDQKSAAPKDARRLQALLSRSSVDRARVGAATTG